MGTCFDFFLKTITPNLLKFYFYSHKQGWYKQGWFSSVNHNNMAIESCVIGHMTYCHIKIYSKISCWYATYNNQIIYWIACSKAQCFLPPDGGVMKNLASVSSGQQKFDRARKTKGCPWQVQAFWLVQHHCKNMHNSILIKLLFYTYLLLITSSKYGSYWCNRIIYSFNLKASYIININHPPFMLLIMPWHLFLGRMTKLGHGH